METLPEPERSAVLARSLLAAAAELGVSRSDIGAIIGRNRTSIDRKGVDPDSKAGELALMFIRIYRSLFALMGGDTDNMRHFLRTENLGTRGVPFEQLHNIQGIVAVCGYLDAMRGKG
ncbi:MbcA/ParS/Xre antitoxin family protein [Congregibacter sp.]|uniref:MbcA/ParS/Xre antitoxin family protein n=1 Tax=Congregibacter sp. TaxID=2744308 RepID=UPI00385C67F3